jgi:type III secretory pathway component EscT
MASVTFSIISRFCALLNTFSITLIVTNGMVLLLCGCWWLSR